MGILQEIVKNLAGRTVIKNEYIYSSILLHLSSILLYI